MTSSGAAYETLARLVGERTGLHFSSSRRQSLELGIRRAMQRSGTADAGQYCELIARDERALDDLISELTVGETYFFREPRQFEFIRHEALRDIRRRRGDGHVVRAWSAGCASGEEPYSLAMLFDQEGLGERSHVLATDISRAMLAKARLAEYRQWSLRGQEASAAQPYLDRQGDQYVLDKKIRRRVAVEYLNLALDVYPSFATGTWGLDLILCRNVMIYFDRDTVPRVAHRLFASLADGGWLITGASDPPLWEYAPFRTVATDMGVMYQRVVLAESPSLRAATEAVDDAGCGVGATSRAAPACPARLAGPTQPPSRDLALADPIAEARAAYDRGDYVRTVELTRHLRADPAASALHVRALANSECSEAERACAEATVRHPLIAEMHYLHAVLLMELGRYPEAAQAARRVLYLDRSLAVAHFTLGSILQRHGDLAGAGRAFRNARALCVTRPADEIVPLSDGEHAGRLAEAAAALCELR